MEEKLLSIVLPVYNGEKYIETCLKSLCFQLTDETELIIVDDGSTDNSLRICECYARNNSKIRVFSQNNKGRVEARNVGIRLSTGKFITFVDDDDKVTSQMCCVILDDIKNNDVDLLLYDYVKFKFGIYCDEEFETIKANFFDEFNNAIWGKVYRKKLLLSIIKHIPHSLYFGEDLLINAIYLERCKNLLINHTQVYDYCLHDDSTCSNIVDDLFEQFALIEKVMNKCNVSSESAYRQVLKITTFEWNKKYVQYEKLRVQTYFFNYENLPSGKIALYGAGDVGKDYYRQIINTNPSRLSIWVDKNYMNMNDTHVDKPDMLNDCTYDFVLVAVLDENLAQEIIHEIREKYNIKKEIIWIIPNRII